MFTDADCGKYGWSAGAEVRELRVTRPSWFTVDMCSGVSLNLAKPLFYHTVTSAST